jgi:myo-inositol 2-dehydrogenase/D-chiro-inositol 1-dehydrogenase
VRRIVEARVVAVADVRLEAAEQCAAELAIEEAVQDHRAVLENPKVEAVVICSSTDTHSQMIEEAAGAGKHIFCEKPIDFDLPRIDRALAAADKAGVKLQIGFNRRFDPNFRRMREVIQQGKIGDLHLLRITSRDPQPPPLEYVKVSGGLFLDMTIHDFDMARYLSGAEAVEVYTAAAVRIDPAIGEAGDVDTAVVTLEFENGALGTIDNSRRAVYGYDQRVEAFGSEGMVDASNTTPTTVRLSTSEAVKGDLPHFFFIERYTDSYIAELKEFVTCIIEDTDPPVTGIDGRVPVVMGKAARLSLDENRPVRLAEID